MSAGEVHPLPLPPPALPPMPKIPGWSEMTSGGVKGVWNRVRLASFPRSATPFIIAGIALTIIGTFGFVTALIGHPIPGLGFLTDYIPVSLALSLVMIRAGFHCINNGVAKARQVTRWRQEGNIYHSVHCLTGDKNALAEAAMCNFSLPTEIDLTQNLSANGLHGKTTNDIFLDIPQLDAQPALKPCAPTALSISDRWYNFWLNSQSTLGILDFSLGQIMLVAGITSLIFLGLGPSNIPASFNILAQDPYLSISFSLLLIGYWVDCTKRGLRMLKLDKREAKRDELERDFRLMALADHLKKNNYAQFGAFQELIKQHYLTKDPLEKSVKSKPSTWAEGLHELGKRYSPYLDVPSIVIGTAITLLGLLFFVMSATGKVPSSFDFLTQNIPLSMLYATTLMTTGFYALYRGVSGLDHPQKKGWKDASKERRKAILSHLFYNTNTQLKLDSVDKPVDYPLRTRSLKVLGVICGLMGAFLVFCSLVGFAKAAGVDIDSAFSFIKDDPSFSAFFCLSLFAFGGDGISNAQRMFEYNSRKSDDYQQISTLKDLTKRYNLES